MSGSMRERHLAWRSAAAWALAAVLLGAGGLRAEDALPWRLVLDPAESEVRFELGATLHTVHGGFALREGEVRFDPASGAVSGRVVIDAASGATGNATRDRNMHARVLESQRYPEIVLVPERIEVSRFDGDALEGVLHARIQIHGGSHPVAIPLEARRVAPDRGHVEGSFQVPFVAWGLEDPSNFLLRVDPTLAVHFAVNGRLEGAEAAGT
jgi:polyisoprenoid-binding protein YceI